jgi:methanogenic corrinoid protein MtbC1
MTPDEFSPAEAEGDRDGGPRPEGASPDSATGSDDSLGGFLVALQQGDLVGTTERLQRLHRDGTPLSRIIDDLLTPVMVEVGRRWDVGEWTQDEERSATATVDAALAAFEARYVVGGGDGPPLVVACAEGEWHTLPARLAAERLRAKGHHVAFIGPTPTPAHLGRYLQQTGATALGLSCTLDANLPGARRCIEAAHAVGVPVVGGGAAFDGRELRGLQVGVDAVNGVDELAAFLRKPAVRMAEGVPTARANRQEAIDLEVASGSVVDATMAELALRSPPLRRFDRGQIAQLRDHLVWLTRYAGAAVDLVDPTILPEYLDWARGRPVAQSAPEELGEVCLSSLQSVLATRFPLAGRMLREATDRMGPPVDRRVPELVGS